MKSGRGGYRENSGRKPVWRNSETTVIRVPKAIVPELMELAKKLDHGENCDHDWVDEFRAAVEQVLNDPSVTRHGKDRGAVRRSAIALAINLGIQIYKL